MHISALDTPKLQLISRKLTSNIEFTNYVLIYPGFQTQFYGPLLVLELKIFNIRFYESEPREDLFSLIGPLVGPPAKKCLKTIVQY